MQTQPTKQLRELYEFYNSLVMSGENMKALDLSKFRKSITKNISGISTGFRDPSVWIPTGNYALNFKISGDFLKGVPLGKVTILAGESGSGKSFIASGNLVREAQA